MYVYMCVRLNVAYIYERLHMCAFTYSVHIFTFIYMCVYIAMCAFNSGQNESSEESDATPRVVRFPPAMCMCVHTYIQNCAVLCIFVYTCMSMYIDR